MVYPNGTIRDQAIERVKAVLKIEEESQFVNKKVTTEEILEAAEYCVNILEACELVPMYDLPSARIACWRSMKEKDRNPQEIKQFAYDMVKLLQEKCLIL